MTEKDIAKLLRFSKLVFPYDFPRKEEEMETTEKQELQMIRFLKLSDDELRRLVMFSLHAIDFLSLMYEGGTFLSLDDQKAQRLLTRLSTTTSKFQHSIFRVLKFISVMSFWDAFGNEKVGFPVEQVTDIPKSELSDVEQPQKKMGFKGVVWDTERIRFGKYVRGDIRLVSDVIIVGSGITASLIAERLAREEISVSVLEKGYFVESIGVMDHIARSTSFGGMMPVFSAANTSMVVSRGVGGSTNIYFSVFEDIPEESKEIWRKFHGINTKDMFLDSNIREISNLIGVEVPRHDSASEIMKKIAEFLGCELRVFRKSRGNRFNPLTGERILSSDRVLKHAVHFGTNIYVGFEVQKISRGGRKWFCEGVIRDDIGNVKGKFIAESRALFLCAGPVGNFKILSNSGFRERALGKKLKIHPAGVVVAYFRSVQEPSGISHYIKTDDIYLTEVRFSPGVLTALIPDSAKAELVKRSKMYPFSRTFLFWFREDGNSFLLKTPLGVFPRTILSGEDIAKFLFALKELALALLSAGASEIILPIRFSPAVSDIDTLSRWDIQTVSPKHLQMISLFQTGGCPMSYSSDSGIVDSTGRVFGERALFVSDTSVMPDSSLVPPLLTASALSNICAESFLERKKFIF